MKAVVDLLSFALILTGFRLLGASRLSSCIRTVAVQAALLSAIAAAAHAPTPGAGVLAVAAAGLLVKAGALPWMLRRAMRNAGVEDEIVPAVGFSASLVAGVVLLGTAFVVGVRLPLPPSSSAGLVPVSLFTMLTGLFYIVSRARALNQVLGYLAMENGIFAFGLSFAAREPLLVELGVMLDVFVAVFVMGITVYHINREFDHIDTDRLSNLREGE
jgi:hydrogenase-4 component E